MAQNINELPEQTLTEILSNLSQQPLGLVLCRTVGQNWRDAIDQHCLMKETVYLEEDDEFLDRKLELLMSSCGLYYFQKTTPNISLTHPQTIKTFKFCGVQSSYEGPEKYGLNVGNARGLLLQIAPFVEHLQFHPIYFNHNILSEIHPFPKLRELHIGHDKSDMDMDMNLEILFSHRFPLLDSLFLCLNYSNETLMDEAYVNFFNFLANHRQTFKTLSTTIYFSPSRILLCDLPDSTLEIDLSKKVKAILSGEQLQIESLELSLPPKYVPAWVPIIASQKKLIKLDVRYTGQRWPTASFDCSAISGILSSARTIRTVILNPLSRVTSDGLDWVLLDLSPLRDAANLTELELRGSNVDNYIRTLRPGKPEEPWIINLHEINSTSLKSLRIDHFVCSSAELQILVDNAPVLETLLLYFVLGYGRHVESGVHGGIIKSFVEKKNKKNIYVYYSSNYSHAEENEKLDAIKRFYRITDVEADVFSLRFC